jgi:hypothetical protein
VVFVQQANPEEQRRELDLGPAGVIGLFRLVPGPEATRYDLPLDRRFQLSVSLTPTQGGGSSAANERRLYVGESLPAGAWALEFRSLRYWTTFTLASTPLTPLFFVLAWWCALALGLGVLLPERRVRLSLEPAEEGTEGSGGTRLRFHAVGGRGAATFPERLAEALTALEEGQP